MYPLGRLPESDSFRFHLNSLDWLKILRMIFVQAVGALLTFGVPILLNFKYVWLGIDFTPGVLVIVSGLAEAIRRALAGRTKPDIDLSRI